MTTAAPSLPFTVLAFLLAIGVLVVIHELGHYWVGRWCGVRAEAFSVGFGREVIGRTDRRGTRWSLAWLPLGGYVRFAGDMNPASANTNALAEPGTFQAASLWRRALIVFAGPAVNLLFAIAVYMGFIAAVGLPSAPAVVSGVQPGSVAAQADFRVGDRVTTVDGARITRFDELATQVSLRPGRPMRFGVERGGEERTILAAPRAVQRSDRFGNQATIGQLGLAGTVAYQEVPLWRLPVAATRLAVDQLAVMVQVLTQMVRGERSLDDLGGPVKIGKITGEQASLGVLPFVLLLAILSLNLAFMNLLPIPMLDGGHLLFYAVEAVRGRPADPAVMEWAFRGGLVVVIAFFLFVTVNDVSSLL